MSAPDQAPVDFATLLDWIEGRLTAQEAALATAQVADGDRRTQATVEWLQNFVDMASRVEFENPPPFVHRNLMRHFDEWKRARSADPLDAVNPPAADVDAELSFDSRTDLAIAGVRGAGDEVVHLAFTSPAGDLLIDVTRNASGRFDIDAQVLPTDPTEPPRFEATVHALGLVAHSAESDELGRFMVREVPGRRCTLRADNGRLAIVVEFDLGFGSDS